jgi:Ca-activated chloride channel family protein
VEPGQYTDVIAAGETAHYYRVAKQPGWGLNVGATTRPASSEAALEGFELELRTPDGASCGWADDKRTNALRERAIVSAGISYVPGVGRSADETCADAEELVVEVAYDDDSLDKEIELVVAEQPPVTDVAALPPGVEDTEPFVGRARVAGEPQPVLGGASFHDAPLLEPGAAYADTLRPGEQLLYRVPVGWGQSARLTVTAGPDPLADEALGVQGNTMQMRAFTPYRQSLFALTSSGSPVSDTGFYNGVDPTPVTFAIAPVRLRNAEVSGIYVDRTTLAGEYVFSVEMGQLDGTRFAAPITLEAEVLGEVEGEPDFDGPTPALQPSLEPSEPSAGAADRSDRSAATDAAAESSSDEQGGLGGVLVAVAAGVVVLLAAGAVLVSRRSRTATPGR